MFENFEDECRKQGYKNIVGIDEVGRGTLFGDVVACAIIMPQENKIDGIKDSKKLSEKKREYFYDIILNESLAVGIGRIDAETIDKINIKNATHRAMEMAVNNLKDKEENFIQADILLIDAEHIDLQIVQQSIIKGDDKCYTIACASIVAKVFRDRLCKTWAEQYPEYAIEKHKGYATKVHREAIKKYGPSELHRKSFLKNVGEW